ncbi:hypothetical protein VPH35_082316 [Triticum aestivum]
MPSSACLLCFDVIPVAGGCSTRPPRAPTPASHHLRRPCPFPTGVALQPVAAICLQRRAEQFPRAWNRSISLTTATRSCIASLGRCQGPAYFPMNSASSSRKPSGPSPTWISGKMTIPSKSLLSLLASCSLFCYAYAVIPTTCLSCLPYC